MSETIRVKIAANGETTIVAEGFQGESCKDPLRRLAAAIGEVLSEEPTAEMYEAVPRNDEVQAGGASQ
jgi:hypothetical protein